MVLLLAAAAVAAATATPAFAVIARLYSVEEFLSESTHVCAGEFEKVDSETRTAVVNITRTIKGSATHQKIKLNFAVGKGNEAIFPRLKKGEPMLFFYNDGFECLAYSTGVWMHITGNKDPQGWWSLYYLELLLHRTYRGSTSDFIALVADIQAGKRKGPPPDASLAILTYDFIRKMPNPAGPVQPDWPKVTKVPTKGPLRQGVNVLSAAVFNSDPGSSDMSLIVQLTINGKVFVDRGSPCKAVVANQNIPSDMNPTGWTVSDFDDAKWTNAKYGVGYGDGDDQTVMGGEKEKTTAIYTRARFNVPDVGAVNEAEIGLDYDDIAVVYINGVEVARTTDWKFDIWARKSGGPSHEASLKNPPECERFKVRLE